MHQSTSLQSDNDNIKCLNLDYMVNYGYIHPFRKLKEIIYLKDTCLSNVLIFIDIYYCTKISSNHTFYTFKGEMAYERKTNLLFSSYISSSRRACNVDFMEIKTNYFLQIL